MPHIHSAPGQVDFVADVYIVSSEKVLLRLHEKYGMWLPAGGHIELNEDPNQAALREAREESGLDVELIGESAAVAQMPGRRELIPPRYMNIHDIDESHRHISLIFFARSKSTKVKPGRDEVPTQWRWMSAQDIESGAIELSDSTRLYALAALRAAAGIEA